MARRTRKTAEVAVPTTQEELDALSPEQVIAAAKAADDADLMKALQERMSEPPPRRQPTVEDNFLDSVALIKETARTSRIPIPSLVKLYELNIIWALNTRNSPSAPPLAHNEDERVGPAEGEVVSVPEGSEPPFAHEVITGEPDDDEETTDA